MADKNITFSVENTLKKLNQSIAGFSSRAERYFDTAVKSLAEDAFAKIMQQANSQLKSTKDAYISGLDFKQIGPSSYMISLEGDWPNMIEEGFPSYSISDKLLKSGQKAIKSGPNAGQPWVKTGKEGQKYAYVPLPPSGNLSAIPPSLNGLQVMNASGAPQALTDLFLDTSGNIAVGKVAATGKIEGFPEYSGITKYQEKLPGNEIREFYIAYRTVSEKGKNWQHPGWTGAKIFDKIEQQVLKDFDKIIEKALR